jgi:formylglycine-generating enzyme required for sulfatase activity
MATIVSERRQVADRYDVFLSYSHNDLEAATSLRSQLEKRGLAVFRDRESLREGDLWLNRLQEAVDACGSFVVLAGRDGVRRWVGAETQVALSRYFGPHDDTKRVPIFPILLGDTSPETLPAFLRLFQGTLWNGADALPESLLDRICARASVPGKIPFEDCPFVGLNAYQPDQAHLFFGRQKETLDALACFDTRSGGQTVRWLEINGNSGCGKSSLMNAGILPLVDQGWLWPRTRIETWRRIGPMMPGERPAEMLAQVLANAFGCEMADVHERLSKNEDGLRMWLRSRKQDDTAFLLAVDQFEELFTFADPAERGRFDHLLAAALADAACPLFVISTVRADFLDRFDDLPWLTNVRNHVGKQWTLPLISADGLREVISGPARLAGLDVSEVKEAMVAEARDEPGALPLVENALEWLWQQRSPDGRLSGRLLVNQGGLAGILSQNADDLLQGLGRQRGRALELLFRLVKVDLEGRRHTRQRIPLAEAIAVAGGGEVLDRLAGSRIRDGGRAKGPLRLVTISEEAEDPTKGQRHAGWVNLIHETLIRSKGLDAQGNPQPYWPTLWRYIEQNKKRAARRERLQLLAGEWKDRRDVRRVFGLAGWSELVRFRGLAAPGSVEQRYLGWSRAKAVFQAVVVAAVLGVVGEALYWKTAHELPLEAVWTRWAYLLGKELPLPEPVPIPEGSFQMGSDRGPEFYVRPVHPVTFTQSFYLGATEVTFAQYDAFATATGRALPNDAGWGRDDRPVINVEWTDARAYVRWLGAMTGTTCRLPSEAEWEYACRAGTTTEYALPAPNGSDDIAGKGLANCAHCGGEWGHRGQTSPVASFPANAWNVYDMHGNLSEWVADCSHRDYENAPKDGRAWLEENGGDCTVGLVRGGSWVNPPDTVRCAARDTAGPGERSAGIGFRVVCSSPIEGH